MLQSYYEEIQRKRNAARFFWLIVFLFAGSLYFFFQGYYPAIYLERFFSASGGSLTESGSLIRSFWIVNINIKNPDTTILLNDLPYTNREKKMVNYGNYKISITKPGYVSWEMPFTIDKETPYYIDDITLLPRGDYTKFEKHLSNIINIGKNGWLTQSGNTIWFYGENFLNGNLVLTGTMDYIGEGKFLSGNTLMEYNMEEWIWKNKTNPLLSKFLQSCKSPQSKNGYLLCPGNMSLLTEKWKTLTGIISTGNGYIETASFLIVDNPDDLNPKTLSLSGTPLTNHLFTEIEGTWYTPWSSGSLISIGEISKKKIETGLNEIEYMSWENGFLIMIGEFRWSHTLTLWDPHFATTVRKIKLPDQKMEAIRIYNFWGNFFLKTSNSLLFFYKGASNIVWLVEGKILAVGENFALYENNWEIWKGSWIEESTGK